MNNEDAVSKILLTKNADYKRAFDASIILPDKTKKIAIVGKRSYGKTFLINHLMDETVFDEIDLVVPVLFGRSQDTGISTDDDKSISELCKNNQINAVTRSGNFFWNRLGSFKIEKTTISAEFLKKYDTAQGFFLGTTKTKENNIIYNACLLIAPDICLDDIQNTTQNESFRNIKDVINVADIILAVGEPADFMDSTFKVLQQDDNVKNGAHKTVILVVIHKLFSNFYTFPLIPKTDKAIQLEGHLKETAQELYRTLNKPDTIQIVIDNLKNTLVEATNDLLRKLEEEIKNDFHRFPVHAALYLPSCENQSKVDNTSENAELITRVVNAQLIRITDVVYKTTTPESEMNLPCERPYVAWSYFLHKAEDISWDLLFMKWYGNAQGSISIHSSKLVNSEFQDKFEKEVAFLLRDYACDLSIIREEILSRFLAYVEANTAISFPSTKRTNTKKAQDILLDGFQSCNYRFFRDRIKSRLAVEIESIDTVVLKCLEDCQKKKQFDDFYNRLEKELSREEIERKVKEKSLFLLNLKDLKFRSEDNERMRLSILEDIDSLINIADSIEGKRFITEIIEKRKMIKDFNSESICKK